MQLLRRKIEICLDFVPDSALACKLGSTFIHYLP